MSNDAAARTGIEERLASLLRHATVSAELPESAPAFAAFRQELRRLYPLTHERLQLTEVTEHELLFRWEGTREELAREPAVLMAHFDVVPVEQPEVWQHPPFAGEIAGGYVWGRGALDDKGALVTLLEAVENLLAAGFTPARTVYLALGGNEESFGDAARQMAALLRGQGVRPWLVLDEGGAVTDAPLPFVRGTAAMVGVGEKGLATVRLTARSQDGHASLPPARPAIRELGRVLARLGPRTFRPRAPRAVARMLRIFAPRSSQPGRALYRLLASNRALLGQVFAALGGEAAAMVRTTVAPTRLSGGSADNVLPTSASAVLNLRLALGETVEGTIARLRRVAGSSITVQLLEGNDPSPESPATGAQFELLRRAVSVSHPGAAVVPYVTMQATDSRHFHEFCPHTYRFAPLFMGAELRSGIHGENERVAVAELVRGELFYRQLLREL